MTLAWRPLRPLELDHEALWLTVGGASLCLLAVALATPGIQLPLCVFKILTGIPCPTCGLTRAVIALSRGDVGRALWMNPLAAVAGIAALAYLAYAAAVLVLRLPRLRPVVTPLDARVLRVTAVTLFALNWAWLVFTGR
jgi:hypothetical protein